MTIVNQLNQHIKYNIHPSTSLQEEDKIYGVLDIDF